MSDFVPYDDPEMFESLTRYRCDLMAQRMAEADALVQALRDDIARPKPTFRQRFADLLRRAASWLDPIEDE